MKRFAAFLRGVSPMNCKMAALAGAVEAAGFTEVKTLLSSGNVVFTGSGTARAIEKKLEAAFQAHLGQPFMVFVRPLDELRTLLEADPFAALQLKAAAKRVVTFLAVRPAAPPQLPVLLDEAKIFSLWGREAFSAYVPGPKGPVFMTLIERTFGNEVTTRTWETVRKVCAAA